MNALRVVVALALVAAVSAATIDFSSPVLNDDLVGKVNSNPKATWVAGRNAYFEGWNMGMAVRSMGALPSDGHLPTLAYPDSVTKALPDNFDWRVANPRCVAASNVLNQGECGSCWAFGAAEAISDRMCIQGNGTYSQRAPLDLVACDNSWLSGENGCQGGQLAAAWEYAQSVGLASESCLPYLKSEGGPVPTCAPDKQPCMPPTFVPTPKCPASCADGTEIASTRAKISSVYGVQGVDNIRAEIAKNGPVEAAFTVYSDFVHYKSGVYTVTPGANALGGHAVEIIGYGSANGTQYWEVRNSWTTTWGNKGYFKIGVDQAGISDQVTAGMV